MCRINYFHEKILFLPKKFLKKKEIKKKQKI